MTFPAPHPRPWFAVTDGQNRSLVVDKHGYPVAYCPMENGKLNAALIATSASVHDELLKAAKGAVREFIWCESDHNLAELKAAIAAAEEQAL